MLLLLYNELHVLRKILEKPLRKQVHAILFDGQLELLETYLGRIHVKLKNIFEK